MKTILFQGDSITDVGRARDNDVNFGQGYPFFAAARLGVDAPGEYRCYNRGISGNRVVDLYARIKADFINLKPDVVSILIGVNDVWHEVNWQNGVDTAKYEKIYAMLLSEIREACPGVKFILMEPYVLKGPATEAAWDTFAPEVYAKAEVVRRLARRFHAAFLPLQQRLDEAVARDGLALYSPDGVHPTAVGHQLIADAWLQAFRRLKW